MVFRLTADDQRGARLVNQDGIHLINNGKVQTTLNPIRRFVDHVVAQIVKTILVVGAVGNVRSVGRLLFITRHIGQVDAHRQAQKVVQLAHPARIAVGQVIVDRDNVDALARQGVEVNRQGGGQGFTFTRAHFRNFAIVQGHAAQHLHVKVAHLHDAFGAFAHDSKRLGQQGIQGFTLLNPGFEFLRFGAQGLVAQNFKLRLHGIDTQHALTVLFEQAVISTAENFGKNIDSHEYKTVSPTRWAAEKRNPYESIGSGGTLSNYIRASELIQAE